jgi:hypothetical protein
MAQRLLLCGPLFATALAIGDDHLFPAISFLNVLGYGWLWLGNRQDRLILRLSVLSGGIAVAGIPPEWAAQLMPQFSRGIWALSYATALLIFLVAASRDPRLALLGGIVIFAITGSGLSWWEPTGNLAIETGLVFVLAHSLRGIDRRHRGAILTRIFFATTWVVHAFTWLRSGSTHAGISIYSLAGVLLALYLAHRVLSRCSSRRTVLYAAVVVILSSPANRLEQQFKGTAPGFMAVALSFFLFGLGTLLAMTKTKWKTDSDRVTASRPS